MNFLLFFCKQFSERKRCIKFVSFYYWAGSLLSPTRRISLLVKQNFFPQQMRLLCCLRYYTMSFLVFHPKRTFLYLPLFISLYFELILSRVFHCLGNSDCNWLTDGWRHLLYATNVVRVGIFRHWVDSLNCLFNNKIEVSLYFDYQSFLVLWLF